MIFPFIIIFNCYLRIWLHLVLVTAHGTFSLLCGMQTRRIFSCGLWDPLPWPGIEPGPPTLGSQSLNHWTPERSQFIVFSSLGPCMPKYNHSMPWFLISFKVKCNPYIRAFHNLVPSHPPTLLSCLSHLSSSVIWTWRYTDIPKSALLLSLWYSSCQ